MHKNFFFFIVLEYNMSYFNNCPPVLPVPLLNIPSNSCDSCNSSSVSLGSSGGTGFIVLTNGSTSINYNSILTVSNQSTISISGNVLPSQQICPPIPQN